MHQKTKLDIVAAKTSIALNPISLVIAPNAKRRLKVVPQLQDKSKALSATATGC
jgi:hypothetical protein